MGIPQKALANESGHVGVKHILVNVVQQVVDVSWVLRVSLDLLLFAKFFYSHITVRKRLWVVMSKLKCSLNR